MLRSVPSFFDMVNLKATTLVVIPAKAGIHSLRRMGSRFRGSDGLKRHLFT